MAIKNIIFDLGGVVVKHDTSKYTKELVEFFVYLRDPMPQFWKDYDRGTISFKDMKDALAAHNGITLEECDKYIEESITMHIPIPVTTALLQDLKAAEYRLYVLSNMPHEYICQIRSLDIYDYFDGDVISSEVGFIKPEVEIYNTLLERFDLKAEESLFIDDREQNVEGAKNAGLAASLFDATNPAKSCAELRALLML
ncbi:MAG: HAD family phosphatase [Rikenellaceae bacterium]